MDTYTSTKIKILTFFSILGVVFIHSSFLQAGDFPIYNFMEYLLGGSLFRFCVPLFFCISGYLFFYSLREKKMNAIWKKFKIRCKTLLLPYLLWCVIFVITICSIEIIPGCAKFINNSLIDHLRNNSILQNLVDIFYSPLAFHMWFIKYLIYFVMLSPFIFLFFKCVNKWIIIGAAILALFFSKELGDFGCIWYFIIGGSLSFNRIDLDSRGKKIPILFFILFLILCLLYATNFINMTYNLPVILALSGIIGIWKIYDIIYNFISYEKILLIASLSSYNFFIYAFHEPTLNILKKLFPFLLGHHQWVYICAYLVNPVLVIFLCLLVSNFIKKRSNIMYSILTGWRGYRT